MASRVTIRLDRVKIDRMAVQTADASAKRAAERTAERANANVLAARRVRTGKLARSYRAQQARTRPGGRFASGYEVGSPLSYASYQEEGVGPIVAGPGKVLRFQPKGSSVFIFRKRTRGFPGAHQLRRAFESLTLRDYLP